MKQSWIIARREIASYFDSLIAYVLIIIFLLICGFFTWLAPEGNLFVIGRASLNMFFTFAYWTLFFFIPAVTMRSLAEENKSGTIELLSTKSLTDWQIVFGKFLAALLLVVIALLCTAPYYFTVVQLGNVDKGATLGGYFGLILLSGTYVSLGILASSTTDNQIVAFLLGIFFCSLFHIIIAFVADFFVGDLGAFFQFFSAKLHFDSISRGVIDSRDLLYFLSLSYVALLIAKVNLEKRNWA